LGDETVDSIAIAVLGDSDTLQVGEPAIAIGNSLGYGQSVTTGVISAINRNINDTYLIQTDAAINPGNSGGALLNIRGEVIGINSSKIADYVIEGMGYAIPISTAKPIINELMLNETKKKVASDNRGFLGISGTDVTEDASSRYGMPSGVYVADVIDGSGAQKAGIEKGDIIVSFDGEQVTSMTGLQGMLEYYEAGTKVTVVLERQNNGDYKEHSVTVTLGKRSQE
jgi:serine protease Do